MFVSRQELDAVAAIAATAVAENEAPETAIERELYPNDTFNSGGVSTLDESVKAAYDALRVPSTEETDSTSPHTPVPPRVQNGEVCLIGIIFGFREHVYVTINKGEIIFMELDHFAIKARYNLLGSRIMRGHKDKPDMIRIFLPRHDGKDGIQRKFYTGSLSAREKWIRAITEHVEYAQLLHTWYAGHNFEKADQRLGYNNKNSSINATTEIAYNFSAASNSSDKIELYSDTHRVESKDSTWEYNQTNEQPSIVPDRNFIIDSPCSLSSAVTEANTSVPPLCTGWMLKKGQYFPSIKLRYFVLQDGLLRYYTSDNVPPMTVTGHKDAYTAAAVRNSKNNSNNSLQSSDSAFNSAINRSKSSNSNSNNTNSQSSKIENKSTYYRKCYARLKGSLCVYGYDVYSRPGTTEGTIKITLRPGANSRSKRRLEVYCADFSDRTMWVSALNAHSGYYHHHSG